MSDGFPEVLVAYAVHKVTIEKLFAPDSAEYDEVAESIGLLSLDLLESLRKCEDSLWVYSPINRIQLPIGIADLFSSHILLIDYCPIPLDNLGNCFTAC